MSSNTSGAVWAMILMLLMFTQSHTGLSLNVSVGENAHLPCVYTDEDLPTVIWKDPNDKTLFKLKMNRTEIQEKRVKTFPHLHHKGNFSIVLQDVHYNDSGKYECIILNGKPQFTTLKVTEKKQTQQDEAHGGAVVSRLWGCHMIALLLSVSFLLQTK